MHRQFSGLPPRRGRTRGIVFLPVRVTGEGTSMALVHCQTGNCDVACEGGCACASDSQTGECLGCICNIGHPQLPKKRLAENATKVAPSQVNLSAQTVPMTQLAKLLEMLFPGRIAIPAGRIDAEVSIELEYTSLEEMALSLGVLVTPEEGADSR